MLEGWKVCVVCVGGWDKVTYGTGERRAAKAENQELDFG